MKNEGKLCPQNFQVWVAFLMGMIVIIIAVVIFDKVSMGRYGPDKKIQEDTYQGGFETDLGYGQQVISLKESDDYSGAWLGIEAVDITKPMANQLDLSISGGVLVSRVIENSPADRAGLLRGDIIYEFDQREVKDSDQLSKLLGKTDPGDSRRKSPGVQNRLS